MNNLLQKLMFLSIAIPCLTTQLFSQTYEDHQIHQLAIEIRDWNMMGWDGDPNDKDTGLPTDKIIDFPSGLTADEILSMSAVVQPDGGGKAIPLEVKARFKIGYGPGGNIRIIRNTDDNIHQFALHGFGTAPGDGHTDPMFLNANYDSPSGHRGWIYINYTGDKVDASESSSLRDDIHSAMIPIGSYNAYSTTGGISSKAIGMPSDIQNQNIVSLHSTFISDDGSRTDHINRSAAKGGYIEANSPTVTISTTETGHSYFNHPNYSNESINRGWITIHYLGIESPLALNDPSIHTHIFRKVYTVGSWDMTKDPIDSSFSSYMISNPGFFEAFEPSYVGNMQTIVRNDYLSNEADFVLEDFSVMPACRDYLIGHPNYSCSHGASGKGGVISIEDQKIILGYGVGYTSSDPFFTDHTDWDQEGMDRGFALLEYTIPGLLWHEDFDLADGTTSDSGSTAWDAVRDTGDFSVQDGSLTVNYSGTEGFFISEVIDISSGPVDVSLALESEGQLETNQDYIQLYQIVDGGSEILLDEKWGNQSPTSITGTSIIGNTLRLVIRTKVSAGSEYYHLDNLCVVPSKREILWHEDFSHPNGTTVDNGSTAWETFRNGGSFDVQNGTLTVNKSGDPGFFDPEVIDISSGPVDVRLELESVGQLETSQDYVQLFRLDGGTTLLDEKWGNQSPTTLVGKNLLGNTLKLLIEAKVSAGSEYYHLDNLTVSEGGECVPWIEDFNFPNGTPLDTGSTSWEALRNGGKFDVQSGKLTVNQSGDSAFLITGLINISDGPVDISLDLESVGSLETSQDYVKFFKIVDGGSSELIAKKWGNQSPTSITQKGITGTSLQLLIETKVSAGSEYYHFDNLSVTPTSLNSGFFAHYQGDNTPDDTSPYQKHAYWEWGSASYTTGQVDNAFDFNGSNALHISINDQINIIPTDAFSYSVWIKPDNTSSGYRAILIKGGWEWDWGLWQNGTSIVIGKHNNNQSISNVLSANTWIHIAVNYDNGIHTVYVDGAQVAQKSVIIDQSNLGLSLGARGSVSGTPSVDSFFTGAIDDIRLYNRTLTQEEITALSDM